MSWRASPSILGYSRAQIPFWPASVAESPFPFYGGTRSNTVNLSHAKLHNFPRKAHFPYFAVRTIGCACLLYFALQMGGLCLVFRWLFPFFFSFKSVSMAPGTQTWAFCPDLRILARKPWIIHWLPLFNVTSDSINDSALTRHSWRLDVSLT